MIVLIVSLGSKEFFGATMIVLIVSLGSKEFFGAACMMQKPTVFGVFSTFTACVFFVGLFDREEDEWSSRL